jgi:hypothetical protein
MLCRRSAGVFAALTLAVLLAGCQTTGQGEDEEIPRLEAGTVIPFTPQAHTVPLNLVEGSYPSLFSGTSFATWVTPAMGMAGEADDAAPVVDSATASMAQSFVVIECHLATTFADMSIAYDMVGMRGVNVYLEMPDGQQVQPSQIIVGSDLDESQRGALKAYGRTNTLLFPNRQGSITVTHELAQNRAVRLVLTGHDTTFAFAWQGVLPGTPPPPPLMQRQGVQRFRDGYKAFFDKMRGVSHTFD